jgi:ABC-type lipoprotein release transport system permease subunit
MIALRLLAARVRSLFEVDSANRLDEELRTHAEMLAEHHRARGLSEEEARYAALRDLGNRTALRQEYRERSGLPLLENFWLDLKYALRTLRRNPAFTSSCVATLAVGLGAMITVLCVVSAFLWQPLPYPNAKSLVAVKEVDPRHELWTFSEPALIDLQERSRLLSVVAAYRADNLVLTGAGEPEAILGAAVTPSFFKLTGMKLVQNSQTWVVVSSRLWKRRWQMDPNLVGRSIVLSGKNYTVAAIGDLAGDLLPGVEAFIPLIPSASESRSMHEIDVAARMRDGVTARQAQAELNSIAAGIVNGGWGMRLIPLSDYLVGPATSRMIWMIFAAVALLWLLACANVAGLQIARGVARKKEMMTRHALGASRARLLTQTLTESVVLAFAGGALGLLIAEYSTHALQIFGSAIFPRLAQVRLDGNAVAVALICLLVSTVLFGLDRRGGGRDLLIVAQVALASILILGATLLLESFLRLNAVDPGFNPDKILSVRVHSSGPRTALIQNAVEQLSELPGVAAASASNVAPFSGEGTANRFRLENESGSEFHSAAWRAVTPGFFGTLGIPLKRGRLFSDADRNGAQEVIILSESMARQYWPNQDPIGRNVLWGRSGSPKTIIGIVGDLRDLKVDQSPAPTMFRPFAQLPDAPMTLLIRTREEPSSVVASVRRVMAGIDHNAALECLPLRRVMSDSLLSQRASLLTVAAFAIVALVTAAFGLYGLISYRVNQQQKEIGIRLALGENPRSVLWGVQKRCLLLVSAGAVLGLPVAFALSRLMAALLYETPPTQASAYVTVFLVFLGVGLAASFGPARRASRLDPAAVIRHE